MKSTFGCVLAAVILCAPDFAALDTATTQATAASLSKQQLLDGWADALGGRGNLQRVNTIHLRGTVAKGGWRGTYKRSATSGGEFRMEVDISAAFHQVSIFRRRQRLVA
jgi:hypothetical protein